MIHQWYVDSYFGLSSILYIKTHWCQVMLLSFIQLVTQLCALHSLTPKPLKRFHITISSRQLANFHGYLTIINIRQCRTWHSLQTYIRRSDEWPLRSNVIIMQYVSVMCFLPAFRWRHEYFSRICPLLPRAPIANISFNIWAPNIHLVCPMS